MQQEHEEEIHVVMPMARCANPYCRARVAVPGEFCRRCQAEQRQEIERLKQLGEAPA